jgi:hypothetical protein
MVVARRLSSLHNQSMLRQCRYAGRHWPQRQEQYPESYMAGVDGHSASLMVRPNYKTQIGVTKACWHQ